MDEFTARASQQLQVAEGVRLRLYQDTKGLWTIGVGHNIQANGISPAVAELMLAEDIAANVAFLAQYAWWTHLSDPRRLAILDMSFMGAEKLLHFVLMIAALVKGDFVEAKAQVVNSQWYQDVGKIRGDRVATMIETGAWAPDIHYRGST